MSVWSANGPRTSRPENLSKTRPASGDRTGSIAGSFTGPYRCETKRGSIVRWYGTSTDVEDLKRAEEALRDRARLLDLTHDSIFVRDVDDVITYWNKGAEGLYGWTREEALGQVSHALMRTIFPRRCKTSMRSCFGPAAGRESWCTPPGTGGS